MAYVELPNQINDLQTLDLNKTATVTVAGGYGWSDMLGQAVQKGSGANDPTWSAFKNGIYAYSFSATAMKELWFVYHVGHDYAPGTSIYLHTHWGVTGTHTGVVRWGFEYTIAKGHKQSAFPTTTTVYVNQAGTGSAHQHMIAETEAITSAEIEPDSLVMVRIFRDAADAADTQTGAAFLLMADVHYQASAFTTKNRAPNFYL